MTKQRKKRRTGDIDRKIGQNLQKLRRYHELSQNDLATVLDVTFQQVQKYEAGANRISAARLYSLHRHFGIPLEFFFGGLDHKNGKAPHNIDADATTLKIFNKLKRVKDDTTRRKIEKIVNILIS